MTGREGENDGGTAWEARGARADSAQAAATGRALVALEAPDASRSVHSPRPLAGLLAHLIACREGAETLRSRRRLAPRDAAAVYRQIDTPPPLVRRGALLTRTL